MSDDKRAFWRAWLPGAVIGWVLGTGALLVVLASLVGEAEGLQQGALPSIALMAGAGGFAGLLLGLGQGIYLRPRLEQPLMWPLYSAVGWLVGGGLIGVLVVAAAERDLPGIAYTLLGILVLIMPGGLAGALQRRVIGIPAWVTASTFSVSIGLVVSGILAGLLPGLVGLLVAGVAGGLVAAYLAGDALWRMMLDPPRRRKKR
jgi:hypothetical protein